MGTTPVYRRGDTVLPPALLAGGPGIAGGHKRMHSRFAGASGNHHCLKNGQSADFQSAGHPV